MCTCRIYCTPRHKPRKDKCALHGSTPVPPSCTQLQLLLLKEHTWLLQDGVTICLAWTHPCEITGTAFLRPKGCKRKRGQAGKNVSWGGYNAVLDAALAADPDTLREKVPDPLPCRLSMKAYHRPVLVGGRYLKLQRGVAQSPWFLPGRPCEPKEASVQVRREPPSAVCKLRAQVNAKQGPAEPRPPLALDPGPCCRRNWRRCCFPSSRRTRRRLCRLEGRIKMSACWARAARSSFRSSTPRPRSHQGAPLPRLAVTARAPQRPFRSTSHRRVRLLQGAAAEV